MRTPPSRLFGLSGTLAFVLGLAAFAAAAQGSADMAGGVRDRGVSVREIEFSGPAAEPIEATLVAPSAPGRYPAVLFVHWYGPEHTTSNRTQYIPDALALASHGIVSLLVDTPWSTPSWFGTRKPEDDVAFSSAEVKRLNRAADVLASLDRVDPNRLALVGHDFGAMYGAIVATQRRFAAFAFIAGTSKFGDWFTLGRKLDDAARAKVFADLAPFDPLAHMPKLTAGAVLLQFATKDPYVTAEAASALAAAVSVPKELKSYEWGHDMNREAMDDRVAWLVRTLTKTSADATEGTRETPASGSPRPMA